MMLMMMVVLMMFLIMMVDVDDGGDVGVGVGVEGVVLAVFKVGEQQVRRLKHFVPTQNHFSLHNPHVRTR